MTSLLKLATVGGATAASAAAVALTWAAMGQAPKKEPAAGGTGVRGAFVICAGADSILRGDSGSGCPAGQTMVPLTPETSNESSVSKILDDNGGGNAKQAPRNPQGDDRLSDLERRLDRLRLSPLFTVVDGANRPIFAVRPNGVVTYNGRGTPVAALLMFDGGLFRAISGDGAIVTEAGVSAEHAGLRISEGSATRLDAGRQSSGAYSLKALSTRAGDDTLAGIGESRAGTGAIVVSDTEGHVRSSMTIVNGRGAVNVLNEDGYPVGFLSQSQNGAGLFRITDAGGQVVVGMDVNQDRYGAVLTGPQAGMPYVPSSGLPGSYFFGCAGGGACRD